MDDLTGKLVRRMPWTGAVGEGTADSASLSPLLSREWLVTNGLGGYASGSVSGVITRRYHGLLVAALPAPLGRVVMLSHVAEQLRLADGTAYQLGGEERSRALRIPGAGYLTEFRLETGLPVWRYEIDDIVVEKRLLLPHLQNSVHVNYRLVQADGPVRLQIRPSLNFRPHDAPVSTPLASPHILTVTEHRYEISGKPEFPPLRMLIRNRRPSLTYDPQPLSDVFSRIEASLGYEAVGELWSPGLFQVELAPAQDATLVASTEPWETICALQSDEALSSELDRRRRLLATAPPAAREGSAAELVLAADQFIIRPAGRVEDGARARAAGDEVRTVIAGYHWFTDWGRDTMISLDGLTLATGRQAEAGYILRTFAHYVRDGLIPNMFPEGQREGLYHTADASLWFFEAVQRYLAVSDDRATLELLLPKLHEIVDHHVRGTRFGIGVDPADGLLSQGAEGYQLTWMDAKVDDWVVTPRRGKAVEINALWYNALCLLAGWTGECSGQAAAASLVALAARARRSFNARFWCAESGHLYDVIDGEGGDDAACRPNQIFAISLSHPVLDRGRWQAVVEVVRERLLTPVGLRSLAPGHPDFRPQYYGDLRARDAAYHQGTVWGWLIGPFIDAWLKLHPDDRAGARGFLDGLLAHLGEACIGQISEIFDAEPPYAPRGCVAQAWSVAEVLRCWLKTETRRRGDAATGG